MPDPNEKINKIERNIEQIKRINLLLLKYKTNMSKIQLKKRGRNIIKYLLYIP
jgi:hypothetical protein